MFVTPFPRNPNTFAKPFANYLLSKLIKVILVIEITSSITRLSMSLFELSEIFMLYVKLFRLSRHPTKLVELVSYSIGLFTFSFELFKG